MSIANEDSFERRWLSPAVQKRRVANQRKWQRANMVRANWTESELAEEEALLKRQIEEFLARMHSEESSREA